jgi:hypothetical protein
MNSTLAPKPFSVFELAAGCAALAVVASIAFVGLRVAQLQIPSPAAPPSFSTASIPSSSTVARASGEQLRERAKRADTRRELQPVDGGLADDTLILPKPSTARAPGSPALDGGWQFDDTAGVEQRLIKAAGLFLGFADGIGGADPRNSRDDFPSGDSSGDAATSRAELSTQGRTAEVAVAPSPSVEQHPTRWRANAENTFVGGWAYDTGECRQGQDRGAPLVIGTHSARTASGECDFRSVRREDANRWRIVALCSREGESWSAHVDLKLVGSDLTWSSERGTANYVRCAKH